MSAVLKSTGIRSGDAPSRTRSVLVTIEIALASALVATGGVLLNGVIAAQKLDLGYRVDRVLVMTLDPAQVRYGATQAQAFYRELLDRVRRLPGVLAATIAQSVPLGYTGAQRQIVLEDQQPEARDPLTLWINTVSPGYFELMHVGVLAGRGFEDRDTASSLPVAVVNENSPSDGTSPAVSSGSASASTGRYST